ncbi:YgeY family selenium metabolism-linked hydrolase [uncultured Dysosmobacter sp.]|uniref:YgeY family selenium metabolism-linked hydrolase n=1 Tax=uncultured Dysosmobacter sp. TaxID=2591384 RepID=UPI002610CCC5|nr:YgeY family selenium metabolism-linked hydrolase [uncultured Dysosmobacter sp.]
MDRGALLVDFCRQAIRIPSYSGQEQGAAELMRDKMLEYGFDEVTITRHGSVLGRIYGKRPGATILMDGHIDTVDVVDAPQWQHDPFGAEIVDGKIYGRGASDMKGSVTAMVSAAAQYAEDCGKNFSGTICVSCTVHEECFEGVSSREITKLAKPDFVIIGEATSTTVKIGQRGRAEVVVETEGVSCHSSNPEKGVNAVYQMMTVIEEIRKIVPNEHPILGKGILELTDIVSSPYPGASVVPALCRATFDRRTLVGEDEAVILGQVDDAIQRAAARVPGLKARAYLAEGRAKCWTGEDISAKRYFPAWLISEEDPRVQKVLAGLEEAGIHAPISHFAFCTNGSHFSGEAGIPAIGYGPSLESLAHVRDEYIEISQLEKAYQGFQCILRELTK